MLGVWTNCHPGNTHAQSFQSLLMMFCKSFSLHFPHLENCSKHDNQLESALLQDGLCEASFGEKTIRR